jgi:hypothetical protein
MPVRATISAPLAMFCVRSVRYYAFPYVLLALKFPRDRIPGVSIFTTDHYKKLQKITVFLDRNPLPRRSVLASELNVRRNPATRHFKFASRIARPCPRSYIHAETGNFNIFQDYRLSDTPYFVWAPLFLPNENRQRHGETT